MYDVVLFHLSADARQAASSPVPLERARLDQAEFNALLRNFTELDAIENATADPEIRVRVRHESYLLRTVQRKIVLYDVLNRELPGQVLTLAEAIAELDGSAARTRAPILRAPEPTAGLAPVRPVEPVSRRRLVLLGVLILALIAGIAWAREARGAGRPAGFVRASAADAVQLRSEFTGVFLTGNEPGAHGLVLESEGVLKIFELRAALPPLVVYATVQAGRAGDQPVLATDQPGGLVRRLDADRLEYAGEIYRRVP